ncbi:MAG: beta-ketoacyl synthase N-terminal-like domain-containing protein, partial [Sutterella sp.]
MPAIYIHAFRLLSHLGDNPSDTLAALAGRTPLPEGTAPGAVREDLLDESKVWLSETLPGERITRGMVTAGALILPLLKILAEVPRGKKDMTALVIGNATSGLADVTAALSEPTPDEPALWLDLELGRPASLLARAASALTPVTGPAYAVSTACTAGAKAIAEGARLLMSGAATAVIAGGADILNPFTDAGFRALGAVSQTTARPFQADRDGLHLGEGGGFLLMTAS